MFTASDVMKTFHKQTGMKLRSAGRIPSDVFGPGSDRLVPDKHAERAFGEFYFVVDDRPEPDLGVVSRGLVRDIPERGRSEPIVSAQARRANVRLLWQPESDGLDNRWRDLERVLHDLERDNA